MRWTPLWGLAVTCLPLCLLLRAAERWEMQYFYDKNDSSLSFIDLQFPSPQRGIALGFITEGRRRKPVVALTADGGRAWDLQALKEPGFSLFFLDETTGWLVGQKNRLWKTTDGGRTWASVELRDVRAQPIRLFFLDQSRGWLLCNQKQVYSTEDGGRSWRLLDVSRKPDVPDANTVYTWAAFFQREIGLLTGWSREPDRQSILPEWMQPDLIPLGRNPTIGIVLTTSDGGRNWKFSLLRQFGEIVRVRISRTGVALMLVRHPDSFSLGSEIVALDIKALRGGPAYADKNRFLTDIAFAGPDRAFAVAIDQEGRTPFPAIPAKLRVLQSTDTRRWTEMEVDYRAEARQAVLAVADSQHAWLATDTGMILKLASE